MTQEERPLLLETERWLVDYVRMRGQVDDSEPVEALVLTNYFERELLDSLAIVEMVVAIEDDLGVRLESEHMQDPRFCTLRGLAEIVEEARGA
jgi:acyl carrier protein